MAVAATQDDIAACYPRRAVGAEQDGERVVLLRPRYMSGLLARWVQPRLRKPHFRVRLDRLGSFVWNRCDGTTRVADIADAMASELSEEDQVQHRVVLFVRELARGKMVVLLREPEPGVSAPSARP